MFATKGFWTMVSDLFVLAFVVILHGAVAACLFSKAKAADGVPHGGQRLKPRKCPSSMKKSRFARA